MRRAAWAAAAVLALAMVWGLWRAGADIENEVDSAIALATMTAHLGVLGRTDDASALAELRAVVQRQPLRHLVLSVHDAQGLPLLAPPPVPKDAWPVRAWLSLQRLFQPDDDTRQVRWTLARPDGSRWTVTVAASHEAERREAMASFAETLTLLAVCIGALLLVMRWAMLRAFRPLGRMLDAIAGIEHDDLRAVQALPTMPVREMDAVAGALRHLGHALDAAQAQRRLLSRQVLTLQEDERARLARELHDEFGQRLTALRVDAAWLQRRVGDDDTRRVVEGMTAQCQQIQADIRLLLARLQPFGPAAAGPDGAADTETPERLAALLRDLVEGWSPSARPGGVAVSLSLRHRTDDTVPWTPWPADHDHDVDSVALPRALALAVYRMSQEALTNVARHAQATQAELRVHLTGAWRAGAPVAVDWSVRDDGAGLSDAAAAARRGNGLAGLRERAWAQGGELHLTPGDGPPPRPGLVLSATLSTTWLAAD